MKPFASGALAFFISTACLAANAFGQTEEKQILKRCEENLWPVWDCGCVVQEFTSRRAADGNAGLALLLSKIYKDRQCYDHASTVMHFSGVACEEYNARYSRRDGEVDCGCFGNAVADQLAESGASSISTVARAQARAGQRCR